ncbi:MAG: hypothetical protein US70_C0012G0002 [Parcubacteria group bacterium GW2011_GWD2_38_11]|nr:MAG: hypothetical protein US70_C0012G0002 [Parcubacteria group bacterium GW2011_GWD2_38_11]
MCGTSLISDEIGLNDESLDDVMFIYDQNYSETAFSTDGKEQAPGNSSYIFDDLLLRWCTNRYECFSRK